MRTWTDRQQDAIDARQGTVIVSAAAGSGKTSVLVERLIQRLTDKEHPSSANKILVVTYTNAAAKEMKERVEKAITDLIRKNPKDKNLQKQQMLIPSMQVSTVHSFCSKLTREYFYQLDIAPDYKIISEKQREEMVTEAVQKVVSDRFIKGDYLLADVFSSEKNDQTLFNTIVKLYEFTNSHLFPQKWLDETCNMYKSGANIEETLWGKVINTRLVESLKLFINLSNDNLKSIECDTKLNAAYGNVIKNDIKAFVEIMESATNKLWDDTRDKIQSFKWQALTRVTCDDESLRIRAKDIRDKVKKEFNKVALLYEDSASTCTEYLEQMYPIIKDLVEVTKDFSKEFSALKKSKKFVDYGDLEHMTIDLLLDDNNGVITPSTIANELSARFDEIMIDEYQDTNEVQDWIFRAISKKDTNKFMVGDLKQCIYSFRQAMPDIFINYKESFKRYNRESAEYPATIVLDQNFRSRDNVIDSVNFIFQSLMSKDAGGVDYVGDEALSQGATYQNGEGYQTELCFLEKEDIPVEITEARFIAQKIKEIVDSKLLVGAGDDRREITYKDFAILLRTANKYSQSYSAELEKNGVPAKAQVARPFFDASEVVQVLSFLQVIHNPNQDIPLLSVLMGVIYGFSATEIGEFRLGNKNQSIYVALTQDESGKFSEFLKDMEDYRLLASHLPAHIFIDTLYQRTGYLEIMEAMEGGEARIANLRLLRQYAKDYQDTGFGGVSGFVGFMERLMANKSNLEGASLSTELSNAVQIMSIHKSKGLEFPVCFVAGCGRAKKVETDSVVLNSKLGMGIKVKDPQTQAKYNNFVRDAIQIENTMEEMSEELRVLYVATTRAREKLIFVSTLEKIEREIATVASLITTAKTVEAYSVKSVKTMAQWLLICGLKHPNGNALRKIALLEDDIINRENYTYWQFFLGANTNVENDTVGEEKEETKVDDELYNELKQKLNFVYQNKEINQIPAKVTASVIAHKQSGGDRTLSRPAFLSFKGLTPAERGTAVHNFLQFCDLKEALQNPQKEVERLVQNGFITKDQGDAVNLQKVKAFLTSPVGQKLVNSTEFYRELRFSAKISANLINQDFPKETEIILQGAVDCAFVEDGKMYILDFKTDRVEEEQHLVDLYGIQLKLYAKALEQVKDYPVEKCYLYSFYLNKEIEVI